MGYSKLAIGLLIIVTVQSMRLKVNIQPVPMAGRTLTSLTPSGGSLPTSDSNPNLMSRQSCPKEKECQKVRGRTGIVGGCVVKPNSIPWQVAIVEASDLTNVACGGSIICPRFVLSASHCIYDNDPNKPFLETDRKVAVGMHNRLKSDKVKFHEIKKFHMHPNHTKAGMDFDFAIVELKQPIGLDKRDAQAIYLPPSPDMPTPPVGTHFFVSGWGRLSKTGSGCYPNTLNAVSLPSISLKGCKEAYAPDNWPVTEDMICTSYPGGGRDTCSGDSGGPLVWLDSKTNQIIQIGVVSWGDVDPVSFLARCGKSDKPGVYSKVIKGLEWIKEIVGNCNKETCDKGNCVTGETLDHNIKEYFF